MRRLFKTFLDLLLILFASILAMIARDNMDSSVSGLSAISIYICITLIVAIAVNSVFGVNRGIWRFTGLSDFVRLVLASSITVAATVILMFWVNRLDGVSRSLPFLQLFFILSILIGARIAARLWHTANTQRPIRNVGSFVDDTQTILVVGVNSLTDFYLRSVEELAIQKVSIAGLLGSNDLQSGRYVRQYKVLGAVENIRKILLDLDVHGVNVNRIVIAEPLRNISTEMMKELLYIENATDIRLDFLTQQLGLEKSPNAESGLEDRAFVSAIDRKTRNLRGTPSFSSSAYLRVKRAMDFVAALSALIVFSPLIALIWGLVAMSIGTPVLFWQRRPGLHGRNFKLYKFRTMGAGHAMDGRKLSDAERTSPVGRFLRNTRLDELPQLFNILTGEMSFVGPRPLLPVDQPKLFAERAAVRPGLTGWAQINGGRLISPEDKGAMDVYYVQNISFALDLKIIWKTLPMIFLRDRSNNEAVVTAWKEVKPGTESTTT